MIDLRIYAQNIRTYTNLGVIRKKINKKESRVVKSLTGDYPKGNKRKEKRKDEKNVEKKIFV